MTVFTAMAEAQIACYEGQHQIARAAAAGIGRWVRTLMSRFSKT